MQQNRILQETYTLTNRVNIPKLGFGTWFIDNGKAAQAVCDAVEVGYRHIDTAQAYENEEGVGKGIQECGVARESLFITTKLAAEKKTYEEAVQAIDESLQKMQLEYLDLLLIHSPQPWADFRGGNYDAGNLEAWRAMESAYKAGKIRAIGVSNFEEHDLENLFNGGEVAPMVNQLLVHIGNTPDALLEYCKNKNILVEAYSPIAHGELLNSEAVSKIAEKYAVSIPQLCIRYDLQLGTVPLPKTMSKEHMKINADVNFMIEEQDMNVLMQMKPLKDYGEYSNFPVFSGK